VNQNRHGEPTSLGTLVGGLASDVQDLVRGEIALARTELEQKLERAMMASLGLFGGGLLGLAGLVIVLQGVAAVLALVVPVWAALLIVGLVVAAIGAATARSAVAALSRQTLKPDRTASNLQKDAQMLKEHT
jgi:uncharacterized membrane protein YqjE